MQALTGPAGATGPTRASGSNPPDGQGDPASPAGPTGPGTPPGTAADPARRPRPAWGVGAAVLALLVAAASGLATSLVLSLALSPDVVGEAGAPGAVLVAGTALAQAVGALLVGTWATSPRRGRGGRGLVAEVELHVRGADLATGAAVALLAVGLLGLLASLLAAAGLVETGDVDNTSVLLAGAEEGPDLLLVAAAVALLAPLWEEVLFRGLLLRSLHRRLGAVPAVVLSSAAFGLLHAQPGRGLALVVLTGALGVLLAHVTLRAGRLGPAIVAHAVFNATTVLLVGLGAAGASG